MAVPARQMAVQLNKLSAYVPHPLFRADAMAAPFNISREQRDAGVEGAMTITIRPILRQKKRTPIFTSNRTHMETSSKPHLGRKITRIRELRGMKQEALAQAMGVSQQTISLLENSEDIDESRLKSVAEALGVSLEGLRNFSDENVINYINSFHDNSINHGPLNNHNCTFNPLDKLLETVDENKRLYERLLEAEKEKVGYLERLLGK